MKVTVERETVCEPGPLGLAAFAFTVFVLSAHNAGWAPDVMWVGPAMFYGGLVLLLAGMWEFKKNNVFGATGFSTFGGFWMSVGFFIVLRLCGVIPAGINVSEAFGWLLGSLLVFNSYMTFTSMLLPKAIFLAFFLTEMTIIFLMIGNFLPSAGWIKAGGYMGVITSCSAWYASFAILFNITAQRGVFPLGSPLVSFGSPDSSKADSEPLNGEP